ncbi:MAG: SDR family oxidoreductase [Proteobacteria bacterium]|nr:SDR family oxidoreductase [Pseudomonadota bacterium]
MYEIDGRTVLITGSAQRIGRATALDLAKRGMNVVIHYHTSNNAAEDLVEKIRDFGQNAWAVQADLSDPSEAEALISQSVERSGHIDVLINSASVFPRSRITDFTKKDLELNIQVNAFSPLILSRAFAAQTVKGVIINFLDSRITDYDKEHAAYHLSKRMLFTITRMLALELAPGIRVSGVAPGLILPPPGEDMNYLERKKHSLPLERFGDLESIVETVRFLIAGDFVTGQVIFVDGGRHLRGKMYG